MGSSTPQKKWVCAPKEMRYLGYRETQINCSISAPFSTSVCLDWFYRQHHASSFLLHWNSDKIQHYRDMLENHDFQNCVEEIWSIRWYSSKMARRNIFRKQPGNSCLLSSTIHEYYLEDFLKHGRLGPKHFIISGLGLLPVGHNEKFEFHNSSQAIWTNKKKESLKKLQETLVKRNYSLQFIIFHID